jgi:hypothetical protein
MTFSDTALPNHHQVLVAAEELAGSQLLDLGAVDGWGIELPIEIAQVFVFPKAGLSDPPFDGPLPAARRGFSQDELQEVQVG